MECVVLNELPNQIRLTAGLKIKAAAGAIRLRPTALRRMGSGAAAIGHDRNHQKKVIFHFRASRL